MEQPPDLSNVTPIKAKRKPGVKRGRRPGTTAGPESGKKVVEMTEVQAKAVSLRLSGATLAQIAEECGYASASGARAAIMSALKIILPDETRDEARRMELARIDRIQQAHWVPALRGDTKSASMVLQCVKFRREMLGLDAPAQVNVTLFEGEPVSIEVLQVLDEDALAASRSIRDKMQELAQLKAGAIETTGSSA